MVANEFGVFLDYEKIEASFGKEEITIKYGEYNNQWLYSVNYDIKNLGQSVPLWKGDTFYASKNIAIDKAFDDCCDIIDRIFENKKIKELLLNEINKDKFKQLELF